MIRNFIKIDIYNQVNKSLLSPETSIKHLYFTFTMALTFINYFKEIDSLICFVFLRNNTDPIRKIYCNDLFFRHKCLKY